MWSNRGCLQSLLKFSWKYMLKMFITIWRQLAQFTSVCWLIMGYFSCDKILYSYYIAAIRDSMGRVITQTRSRAFQTLSGVFQTLGRAESFQKLGRTFWNKILGRVFWSTEFSKIWYVKSSLHKSKKNPELVTKLEISAFSFQIFHSI